MLEAVMPEDILSADARLLKVAQSLVPKLPYPDIDILIVKEMGKCYSGTGMDTKVIGRIRIDGVPEPVSPHVKKLAVLRLAQSSDGNALGVGLADITTRRLIDSIDYDMTYSNLIHTTFLERGKIPVHAPSECAALEMAFHTIGAITPEEAKVMIIDNTLHIDTLWVSRPILDALEPETYTLLQEKDLTFLEDGTLAD